MSIRNTDQWVDETIDDKEIYQPLVISNIHIF
jgi:hypothetical protein